MDLNIGNAQGKPVTQRGILTVFLDNLLFPIRAFLLPESSKWGLTSLRDERMLMVKGHTQGYTLDMGCGPNNIFINYYCVGNGIGLDVFPYKGVDNIVKDMTNLPFPNETFDSITLIAAISHIPQNKRVTEFNEIKRILKNDGQVVFTEGEPVTQWMTHKWVWLSDTIFGTHWDVDTERGMEEGESYCVPVAEIRALLQQTGFSLKQKTAFQWGLNNVYVAVKKST